MAAPQAGAATTCSRPLTPAHSPAHLGQPWPPNWGATGGGPPPKHRRKSELQSGAHFHPTPKTGCSAQQNLGFGKKKRKQHCRALKTAKPAERAAALP